MNTEMSQKNILKARGICVVIPTYNNEKTVGDVVRQTLLYCSDIIVVNDGCTDKTNEILASISGITIVTSKENRGKGHALKIGFKKAIEMGFSYAVTMDSDGQHYPEDLCKFLKANQENPGALIVGARNLEGVDRSASSDFANKFSNFWFFVQTGRNLPDTQTGYRLYPLKKLHGLSLLTSRYEAELELLVFSSWHGVKLVSIPINVYYPTRENRVSHFNPIKDFTRISILNTFLCGMSVAYGLPMAIFRKSMVLLRTLYTVLFFVFFSSIVFTPLTWLYFKIGGATEHKREVLHKLIFHASRFVMLKHGIPGTRFSYKLPSNEKFDKPAVIICNHQSHFDLMCKLIFTPKIVFLTNSWVWNNPFYGFMIRNAEYIPVTRGIDEILPKLRSLVDKGYSIAVYPEGTRSATGKIGRFHQGAFYIAEQLGIDILPICLYGTGKVLPKKKYALRKAPIYVEVNERLSQETLGNIGDVKRQAAYMRRMYEQQYFEICNKMEQDV